MIENVELNPKASIILIGGNMVLDDGSELDSRQPIADDPKSEFSLKALQNSRDWWEKATWPQNSYRN